MHPQESILLAGTYTDTGSQGIYSFSFNKNEGSARMLHTFQTPHPSFLITAPEFRKVYAINETDGEEARLLTLDICPKTGSMHLAGNIPSYGDGPCHVSRHGLAIGISNYGAGNMSIYRCDSQGMPTCAISTFKGHTGGPCLERQSQPHVHSTLFGQDGKYLYATDFSNDCILVTEILPGCILPIPDIAARLSPGTGPRHMSLSPDGQYLYVIGEINGEVSVFHCLPDGQLKHLQTICDDHDNGYGSAHIVCSQDGKFLYTSHRVNRNGISLWERSSGNGTIRHLEFFPTGIHPRHFCISPDGKFLLVACRDSNSIDIYHRNASTGKLTVTGQHIDIPSPVCVQFYQF